MHTHTHTYNRAHDDAQRLARRYERDFRWAKERRRQQEREIGEARNLLATRPILLARKTIVVSLILLFVIAAASWAATGADVPAVWMPVIQLIAAALVAGVLVGALVSLMKIRARRAAAHTVLRTHDARLAHTQYHIDESVHSFMNAQVDVRASAS